MKKSKSLSLDDIRSYVEKNIATFHENRLKSLQTLKLDRIISRKNPYLLKAKNILTASDFVKTLLDAFLSSQEETIFGDFLEDLAIHVCGKVYGGKKSPSEGIDLDFEKENKRYIVAIKSGPNWGNSSQIRKMREDFKRAKKILGGNTSDVKIVAVNGCCYGRDNNPDKGDYLKLCGQRFWQFISGNAGLYTRIVEPLGHKAKERNEDFLNSYSSLINVFTQKFIADFCVNGMIDWEGIVRFNSSAEVPEKPGRSKA
ncbi:MAG: cytosolic protein [Deltaproteobacteria bacterium]|nr:cytosolic protein [Deltaproteobacteria bacterium]MBI5903745.1 cytosolic protein [Deltaproteobacteria bacterium]